ncbi:undecaprenyldiphospho-muramoylpentapeptide beta-N-acetylglucosaminyltransferase [Oryzicola mucosus]|uniref:UDP-N-acetylglucosamine--N-acetylmuramyl-(pentapeptide) pyrophosphoryl-undecaprenol N-acetylglucosamine transferase n=1 Tax=Oryzicola mucosus TaxID=2767425 RepID=A0A8J6PV71_9HYPH|nr:undecaprenyldiphospho-muramoylpentapeptide beta-N-acetylglucosaminyltransferase [Oryzicola mucosus]MBD0414722.1 undecaprenyldiphospho-muramoylpentapeptide beta-N-acetylglucosaminyltransferase [Oryzicola mucosus]
MSKGVVLLSAGGTGGHLFPAEALAHELAARGWEVHLATDARANRFAGHFPAKAVHPIASATFGSKNPIALMRSFWTIWKGVRQATALLARIKPVVVVGFGGYPTLPPLYAATRRGVPAMVHEQNAVMGRANKALAARVSAIAGGFLRPSGTYADKIVQVGNPVRPAVLALQGAAFEAPKEHDAIKLLVFGGSQGARFFSEMVPEAIAKLPDAVKKRLRVTQQARAEDETRVNARYTELGVSAEVAPFFSNLPNKMADAHLVLSRAGASTVLELSVIGRPSILVPLPHALDDDQGHNAQLLVDAGAALLRRQPTIDADSLAGDIMSLIGEPNGLARMAASARGVAQTNATQLLADLTEAIASGKTITEFKEGMRP